jgi:ferrochelatase
MSTNTLPERADSAHRHTPRAGVLLINLGTPDAPTPKAIRRYLAEFLADRRVVDLPRALWWPILHGVILPLRPRRLAHAYASIWSNDGSPLLAISRKQADALGTRLREHFEREVPVVLGMRYGKPSIASALAELERKGVRHLLVLPLYPQYSATTSAASFDAVFAALARQRWLPALRTIEAYHDDPDYISALAASLRQHWEHRGRGQHLLMSFHGVPQHYITAGDPYYCHCRKTARLIAEALDLKDDAWSVSFQSRFGKAPWVHPYTDARVAELARGGVGDLDVICPGFAADCLETLEEIAIRYRETFLAAGGRQLRYVPALNDRGEHLAALTRLAVDALTGWLPQAHDSAAAQQRAAAALDDFRGR